MIFQGFNLVKRATRHGQRAHGPPARDTGAGARCWAGGRADDVELGIQALERVGIVDKA